MGKDEHMVKGVRISTVRETGRGVTDENAVGTVFDVTG
jgi:hypothetical protein